MMKSIGDACKIILAMFCKVTLVLFIWFASLIGVVLPLAPIWLPLIIIRKIEEWRYAKYLGMERMDSDAALWMIDTPTNRCIINGFMVVNERLSLGRMQSVLQKKMIDLKDGKGEPRYPLATKFIQDGKLNYYWCQDNQFDINNHVYLWSTNVFSSKDEMVKAFNEIMKRPFNQGNKASPWEYILLYFMENRVEKTCVFVRCHHSLADGVSWMHFMVNNLTDEVSLQIHAPMLTDAIYLLMKLKGVFFMPWTLLQLLLLPKPNHNLHCVKVSGEKQVSWTPPISLRLVKAIKQKLRISINDVLVGCLSANIHQYFTEYSKKIPTDIVASCPFDTRNSLDEAETFSNKFAVVFVPLPMISSDPLVNIVEVNRRMTTLKYSAENHAMRCLARVVIYTLPVPVSRYLTGMLSARSSMVLSNVAGPQVPIKIDNTEVEMMCFWPPQKDDIGLAASFLSYHGDVRIAFCCDTALKAKAHELVKRLPHMFNSLAEKVGVSDLHSTE